MTTASTISEASHEYTHSCVPNILAPPNSNCIDGDDDGYDSNDVDNDLDINHNSDNHGNDDMDTAFIDADESVENETNEEDLNKDMRDFDQVVASFKERVREQWEDPTVKGAVKTFRNNFRKTLDNDNTLVRVMFNFATQTSQNIDVGRKRNPGN